jgi:hypothetical protein
MRTDNKISPNPGSGRLKNSQPYGADRDLGNDPEKPRVQRPIVNYSMQSNSPGKLTQTVETVKRAGYTFRNRENSARRIRFHCTRKQRAATQTSS